MSEIRITFRNEDFTAVSRSLIDLGVVFKVEPREGGPTLGIAGGRSESDPSAARPRQTKKRQAKMVARTDSSTQGVSGVGRLREMAERNRAASGDRGPDAEGKAHSPGIPEDLSAKLLPYSERQEG
jgi:hypothetical protein